MTSLATIALAGLFATPDPVDTGDLFPFSDPVTELVGFKDAKGRVKIRPRYHNSITTEQVLREVVPAADSTGSFYLRRDGHRFGLDSVAIDMGNMPPCMREGRIPFWDPASRRMGFFSAQGKVVVPAIHRSALDFLGGYSLVLPQGRQVCYDGKPRESVRPCEYWSWQGDWTLIDREGKVVVDTFALPMGFSPDWFSARIIDAEADTSRRTWTTTSGRILSIGSTERSFHIWLEANLPRLALEGPGKSDFFPSLQVDPRGGWKSGAARKVDDSLREVSSPDAFRKANHQKLSDLFRSISPVGSRQARLPATVTPFEERIGAVDLCREFDSQRNPVTELSWTAAGRTRTIRFVRWEDSWRILDLE